MLHKSYQYHIKFTKLYLKSVNFHYIYNIIMMLILFIRSYKIFYVY